MRLLCTLSLLLWLSACAPAPDTSGLSAEQHRQQAQKLLEVRDFPAAIEELRLALVGNPNIEDALLYADLLESTGAFKKARRSYKKAARYPASEAQKRTLIYRRALLEATKFDNLKTAGKLAKSLPASDSRFFDLESIQYFKQGQYKQALQKSQQALVKAQNNEEKGWAYFHMAQIYYELRIKRDTFRALFQAINNGRGYHLVTGITDYWEARRHIPFPGE